MSHAQFTATLEGRSPARGALRSSLSEGSTGASFLTLLFLLPTEIWRKLCGPSGKPEPNAIPSCLERETCWTTCCVTALCSMAWGFCSVPRGKKNEGTHIVTGRFGPHLQRLPLRKAIPRGFIPLKTSEKWARQRCVRSCPATWRLRRAAACGVGTAPLCRQPDVPAACGNRVPLLRASVFH